MKAQMDQTVSSIVTQYPSAISLFEGLKIDYCCGGNKSLKQACASAGASLEQVIRSLEEISTPPSQDQDWSGKSISELVDFLLEKHHVYTREQLALLDKLSEKVARVHGQNHPELMDVRRVFRQMAAELEQHMLKEEQVAFPYLLALEKSVKDGSDENLFFPYPVFKSQPQRVLMADHETVGEQLREARRLTGDFTPPADACPTYRAFYKGFIELESDLHRHIHLENNILFPMAEIMAKGVAVPTH
ncbi:MAG TPA: iron-sulfur cluster repair di-iron protein [bacterium]